VTEPNSEVGQVEHVGHERRSAILGVLAVLLFVQGVGMGNTMAPATESIMSVVPP